MQDSMTMDELAELRGAEVHSSDGQKIGSVEEIFYDEQTNQPEWIGIGTGFFGTKRVLVPLEGAQFQQDVVTVPYSKDQVKSSPDVDGDEISQDLEQQLYSHYGIGYSERRSETGLPERGAPRGRVDREGSVTRAEEELRVGKREVEAGRVRLRKWVETEPVTADVELRRETARVQREPIDQPVSGAEIGEQDIEVPLSAEEPVVQKETVAKERISLGKDVETDVERVSDEVRRERVDIEGDERGKRR